MKRLALLVLVSLGLSGCVTEEPYYGGGYRPYPVAGPVIVDDYRPYDRYDRPRAYRAYPNRYDRPYPVRGPRYDRYDPYDRYERPVRVGRRYDDPRRYDGRPRVERPDRPRRDRTRPLPLPPGPGPGPIAAPEVVRTDLPDQPRYRQLQQQRAARSGPQPYIPPVPLD